MGVEGAFEEPSLQPSSESGQLEGGTNKKPYINEGKQGKNIEGHNNYIPGKSILTGDAESLLHVYLTGDDSNHAGGGEYHVHL